MAYVVTDELRREFSANLSLLKKCRRIHSAAFWIYLVGGIMYILYSFTAIASTSWDWLFNLLGEDMFHPIVFVLMIDSVLVAPGAFYLAFRGSLRLHDLCAMLAPAAVGANYALMVVLKLRHFFDRVPIAFIVVSVYSLSCIAVSAANIWANVKYHWLEQQEGFPQFNERFYQQEEDRFQRGIMDEFEQNYRRMKKTQSDSMEDI